jgi:hypothetical protein
MKVPQSKRKYIDWSFFFIRVVGVCLVFFFFFLYIFFFFFLSIQWYRLRWTCQLWKFANTSSLYSQKIVEFANELLSCTISVKLVDLFVAFILIGSFRKLIESFRIQNGRVNCRWEKRVNHLNLRKSEKRGGRGKSKKLSSEGKKKNEPGDNWRSH